MSNIAKTRVVTGYVPIAGHPRSHEEYGKLGYQLSDALGDHPLAVYYERVPDLWFTKYLEHLPPMEPPLKWSKGDNPRKNSLEYHSVQHQKFEWLERAAREDGDSDTFVWMDYGIMSQPGLSAEIIRGFLSRIRKHDFAIPGCWPPSSNWDPIDEYPNWRFLGSLLVVPREDIPRLVSCFKAMARLRTRIMRSVTWEINILARCEPYFKSSNYRWYAADHNAYQFTRYE